MTYERLKPTYNLLLTVAEAILECESTSLSSAPIVPVRTLLCLKVSRLRPFFLVIRAVLR
jgi:hypothetical protein